MDEEDRLRKVRAARASGCGLWAAIIPAADSAADDPDENTLARHDAAAGSDALEPADPEGIDARLAAAIR